MHEQDLFAIRIKPRRDPPGKEDHHAEKDQIIDSDRWYARFKILHIDRPPPTFLTQSHFSLHLSMRYPVMVIIIIR